MRTLPSDYLTLSPVGDIVDNGYIAMVLFPSRLEWWIKYHEYFHISSFKGGILGAVFILYTLVPVG